MDEYTGGYESDDIQEVAEPDVQEGVEESEVTDPIADEGESVEDDDTTTEEVDKSDHAFAEYRRRAEEAERRAEEAERKAQEVESEKAQLEAKSNRINNALSMYGYDPEHADIDLLAQALDMEPDEVRDILNEDEQNKANEAKLAEYEQQIAELNTQLEAARMEKMGNEVFSALQKLDPKLKSEEDVPDSFWKIMAGQGDDAMDYKDAYWLSNQYEKRKAKIAPDPIGKVNDTAEEKTYISEAEYDAMTDEQRDKNHEIIKASMPEWFKKRRE